MEKKRIKLEYPLTGDDGVKIEYIFLKRVKVKNLKTILKEDRTNLNNPEIILPLISELTDLPEKILDEMDMVDFLKIDEEITNFLPESLRTGES